MRGYQQILELFDAWDEREDAIPFGDLVASLRGLELERADLAGALIFADRNYRRIAVRRRPHYEALVLCWKSGQRSPIHNHLGSSCVVRVVEGRATETQYVFSPCGRLVPQRSRTYSAGSVTGCRDEAIHQMANLEAPGQDLITLHVYSPPPSSWNYFKLDVTTLADHDVLLSEGNQTVLVDFGQTTGQTEAPAPINVSTAAASMDVGPAIAIVGGGFSGTMVAVHLSRLPATRPPHVRLFEKSERPARGLAYGTRCDQHLLNVIAGSMSALPDEPSHFLDWLRARDPSAHHGTFAPRHIYGDYLEDLLTTSTSHSNARIEVERDEVVDLELGDGSKPLLLTMHTGRRIDADQVVLALGNPLPGQPQGLDVHGLGRGYIADPWSVGVLEHLEPDDTIALIGSGLTAVDLIVEAHARGHRGSIVTVSRHGLFPCRHQTSPAIPRAHIAIGAGSTETARSLLRRVRSEVAVCQTQGSDWRSVVDSIRPVTQTLWRSLGDTERARFVRHLAPQWDVHRHRVAPQIDEMLQDKRQSGHLIVMAGRVVSLEERNGLIEMSVRRRGASDAETIRVRRVINCTGPARDVSVGSSSLLRALIARGIGRPGPLALGLDVSDSGTLVAKDGREQTRIHAVGPLLKERLWETTAVRELRVQTLELARRLMANP
jgi:uncharacterized NAD(P)/FAD-binding protein YdhS/predicted metal-dependent enzyme (double-stranded beta helix superfamily)